MRVREAIFAFVLVAALSACGGDPESSPSAELTEITLSCAKFDDTAKKITDAQAALYSGTGSTEAIDTLEAELSALKDGAPADVRTALTDLGAAFRDAEEILDKPTPKNTAKLAELAQKLSDDGQKITAYITAECQ